MTLVPSIEISPAWGVWSVDEMLIWTPDETLTRASDPQAELGN